MAGEQDTDRELEPVMRNVLRQSAIGSSSACPDAETFAAWADGALRADEAAACETHAADCGQCRAMMAAFIRTDLPATSPAGATSPAVAERSHLSVPFWRRWQLQWVVPIAAAATAIAIYVVTPEPDMPAAAPAGSPAPSTAMVAAESAADAVAKRSEPLPSQPSPQAFDMPPASSLAPPAPARVAGGAAQNAVTAPPAEQRLAEAAPAASGGVQGGILSVQPTEGRVEQRVAPPAAAKAAGAPAAPPPAPPPPAVPARPAAAAAAVAPPVAPPAAASTGAVAERSRDQAVPAAPRLLASSTPIDRARWRVSDLALEHANDSGRWTLVALPNGVDPRQLTTVASSGAAVWLVGRQGLVLASADGHRFTAVAAPVAADLEQVIVRGPNAATVTIGDGQSFSTDDGGTSWRRQ